MIDWLIPQAYAFTVGDATSTIEGILTQVDDVFVAIIPLVFLTITGLFAVMIGIRMLYKWVRRSVK